MPAIQLMRLHRQTAALAEKFEQPYDFVRALNNLLDEYADRIHRPGQAGEPPPLLPTFYVPKPVLHQIIVDLSPRAATQPETALSLCDLLWEQSSLEMRLIAIALLAQIPTQSPETVLKRIQAWASAVKEERLTVALVQQGLAKIRREATQTLLQWIEVWLASSEQALQVLALRALRSLTDEPDFENLPALFKMFTPFVRVAPLHLQPYIIELTIALAKRSPHETAYFLRQNLEAPENPDTPWLIRRVLRIFPENIQATLRDSLKNREK